MHISDFFGADLSQEHIVLKQDIDLLQLACAFVTTSSGISFLHKKSLLRIDFLPKGPCNMDYVPSIQMSLCHRKLTQGED